MSGGLASFHADEIVYRLGRHPDPWLWPDWAYAASDGTFGNRWDDPAGTYRVLYVCSQRMGAFVETLARFRPDLEVVAGLTAIEGSEGFIPAGFVPNEWRHGRLMGTARLCGRFAELGHAESLATLRRELAPRVLHHGLTDLDTGSIRTAAPRAFTQEISHFVYEWRDDDGSFAGIRYGSRLGDSFENWAIFEPPSEDESPLMSTDSDPIEEDDPDLVRALELLDLAWLPR